MAASLISDLFKLLGEKLLEEGILLLGVTEEALNLRKNLKTILALLIDAENREVEEASVREWLDELKDVAYDIEDILEDWEITQVQQVEVVADQSSLTSQRSNVIPAMKKVCLPCINFPVSCFKHVKPRHEIANNIIDLNKRLDGITKRKNDFHFKTTSTKPKRPITTSFGPKFHVVASQEHAKQKLIHKLLNDEDVNKVDGVPIISVVGVGGIGKTTLARMIFHEAHIMEGYQKIWVCVSDVFDEAKVAKAIAGSLNLDVRDDMALDIVLAKIYRAVEDIRLLLILDDVWTESVEKWDQIICSLRSTSQGSRILLTTRKESVAAKIHSVFTFDVAILNEDESWLLFSHFAFGKMTSEKERISLEGVAREMVKRCNGLPLAIDVLGRFMSTKKTRTEWTNVLHSNLWKLRLEKDVFPSLIFSYLDLPSAIKRCFAICSLFPKDTEMSKNELIRLWMAHGFLQESLEMEMIGEEYFNCLVARSFFQVIAIPKGKHESYGDSFVKMHDIIHDFAQHISTNEVGFLDDSNTIDKDAICRGRPRHLLVTSIDSTQIGDNLNLKVLRTLFLFGEILEFSKRIISKHTLYLRALSIELSLGYRAWEDMKNLIHLRYLKLKSNWLQPWIILPEGICCLRYLQTLDLSFPRSLTLPKQIGKLSSLRHLIFSNSCELTNFPKGIGKLRNLRTLTYFYLFRSSVDDDDNENCSLEDLGELNNLQGELRIINLNEVSNVSEAIMAKLHEKLGINRLTLEFGEGDPQFQLEVLEVLRPVCEGLDYLKIDRYKGRICPQWIVDLENVKEVQLIDMSNLEQLPPVRVLSSLERLKISGANEVKSVGLAFFEIDEQQSTKSIAVLPELRSLELEDMPQWEQWELDPSCSVTVMPSLQHLRIVRCCKLAYLPSSFEALPLLEMVVEQCSLLELTIVQNKEKDKKLSIGNVILPETLEYIKVNNIELSQKADAVVRQPSEASSSDHETVQAVASYLSIRSLEIYYDAHHMTRILDWIPMCLANLKSIAMHHGSSIEWLPPFGLLQCLETLYVNADEVRTIGDEFLGIYIDDQGESPCSSFVSFPRLKYLKFREMSNWTKWEEARIRYGAGGVSVTPMPKIMPSLRYLSLDRCVKLESLPSFFEDVPLETLEICHSNNIMPPVTTNVENDHDYEPAASGVADTSTTVLAKSLKSLFLSFMDIEWSKPWKKYLININQVLIVSVPYNKRLPIFELAELPSLEILHLDHIEGEELAWSMDDEHLKEMMTKLHRQKQSCNDVQSSSSPHEINFTAFPNLKELHFSWSFFGEKSELERVDVDFERLLNRQVSDHNQQNNDPAGTTNSNFSTVNINIMPRLRVLTFSHCPEVKALPKFLQTITLSELKIGDSDNLKTWYENLDGAGGGDWAHWKSNNIARATIKDSTYGEGWRSVAQVLEAARIHGGL